MEGEFSVNELDALGITRPTIVRLDKKKPTPKKIVPDGFRQLSLLDFFEYESAKLRQLSRDGICNELFTTNQCTTKRKVMRCGMVIGHMDEHTALCADCDTHHIHNIQLGIGKVYRAIHSFPQCIADVTRIVELPPTNVRAYLKTLSNKGIITINRDQNDMRKRQVELNPLWIGAKYED